MTRPPLDRRALGRALTELAHAGPAQLLRARAVQMLPEATAYRIGLTGAPGAGKSTLGGRLALHRFGQGQPRVGVLAVDPSSPRTGGAILGDRIRMDELPGSGELYIRSVGSRSSADGLSDNLTEMLELFDVHGFDEVLLETVGVGQAEHAARVQVDTLVLVLLPDSGDSVQAMKAGIMEFADVYVVNKSDLPGAQRMASDIQRITALMPQASGWRAPVLLTSARAPESVAALSQAIDAHRRFLDQAGRRQSLREARSRYRLRRLVERLLAQEVQGLPLEALQARLDQQACEVLRRLAGKVEGLRTPAGEPFTGQAR